MTCKFRDNAANLFNLEELESDEGQAAVYHGQERQFVSLVANLYRMLRHY